MRLDWLFGRLAAAREREAVIWRDQSFSYGELLGEGSACKQRLTGHQVRAGTVTSLEADFSPRAIALLLALIDSGAIIVPLTSTIEERKPRFREIAEVEVMCSLGGDDEPRFEWLERRVENP